MGMSEIPEQYQIPEFEQTVTFKDGTVIKATCGYNTVADELWIKPTDEMPIMEAVVMFSDPTKTEHIHTEYSPLEYGDFDGYTKLKTITTNALGKISVRMVKP